MIFSSTKEYKPRINIGSKIIKYWYKMKTWNAKKMDK
jgi:hypothetical protein